MSDEHQPFIKTPKQLIAVIVLSFVIPIALIIMMVSYVGTSKRDGAGSDGLTEEAIAQRIAPVARFELVDASAPKTLATGEEVYNTQCAACHAAGVAGAPKYGDEAAWSARLGTGYDALLQAALKGKGAMAPQAGGAFGDFEIGRAVVYMANAAGGDLPEPSAPAEQAAEADGETKPDAVAEATAKVSEAATAVGNAASEKVAEAAAAGKEAAEKVTEAATAAADKAGAAVADGTAKATAAGAAVAAAAGSQDNAGAAPATAEHDLAAGKKLYDGVCMACHVAGVAGAPKFGDKAAWAGREEKGIDALAATVISGKGAMPPRGGTAASDEEIADAVAYMVAELK